MSATVTPATAVSDDACPFCGGPGGRPFYARDRNRETTEERFRYLRCAGCGTVFIDRIPAELGRYYAGDYYQFDDDGEPAWRREQHRVAAAANTVGLFLEHVRPGPMIEIGAGTGALSCAAAEAGFEVTAIEMSDRCCDFLQRQERIRAICSDRPLDVLAELQPARMIALWHVLEHLPEPRALFDAAAAKLEPGGVLALAVPNPASLQFRLLKARWAHLDAPRHVRLVPADALVRRGEQLGLRLVAITTNDPIGLECNLFGWLKAYDRRPADPATPWLVGFAALATERALAPLERSGDRGSAVTLLLQREGAVAASV